MTKKYKNNEGFLNKSLNLEIRLFKLTFTKVKPSCPLFKQQNIGIMEKIQNLKSLLASQFDLATTAEMSDLDIAIREGTNVEKISTTPQVPLQDESSNIKVGEYHVGIFIDGFYPGEVVEIETDHITADFLKPVFFKPKLRPIKFMEEALRIK